MGWMLIVVSSLGRSVATMPSLAACEQSFRAANSDDIQSAVCRNLSGDEIDLLRYMPEPPPGYCWSDSAPSSASKE